MCHHFRIALNIDRVWGIENSEEYTNALVESRYNTVMGTGAEYHVEELSRRQRAFPKIDPESLQWESLDQDRVQISFRVYNDSDERSEPNTAVVEAASFGAFVPGAPVARVAVGGLEPGADWVLRTVLDRALLDRAAPFPSVDRMAMRNLANAIVDARRSTHWIGNFNVYFIEQLGRRQVERHRAHDLRVPAGMSVGAMFIVDASCEIRIESDDPEWKPRAERLSGTHHFLIVQAPDEVARIANVSVLCVRDGDGKTVPIEFQFETVEGWGESVGCVKV